MKGGWKPLKTSVSTLAGYILLDHIQNEHICQPLGAECITDKIPGIYVGYSIWKEQMLKKFQKECGFIDQ